MDHTAIDAELEAFTKAVSPTFRALARYRDVVQATPDSAHIARARKRFMERTRDEVAGVAAEAATSEPVADLRDETHPDSFRKLLRTATRIATNDLRLDTAHVSRHLVHAAGVRAKRLLRSARRILDVAPIAKFIRSGESTLIGTPGRGRVLAAALGALCLTYAGAAGPVGAGEPDSKPSVTVTADPAAYPHPFELRAPDIGFYDGAAAQAPTDRFYAIARKALTPEMGADAAARHVSTARDLATACMEREEVCSVHTKGLSIDPVRGVHGISMLAPDGAERLVLTEDRGAVRVHDYDLYAQLSQASVEEPEIAPVPH